MKTKLKDLLDKAYSPYSKVKVSSILITKDEKEFYGVNVENSSYGATICAERNAILNAITNGHKPGDFKEIHVYSNLGKMLYPCSICRQVMSEMFDDKTDIYIHSDNEQTKRTLEELVPYRLTKDSF